MKARTHKSCTKLCRTLVLCRCDDTLALVVILSNSYCYYTNGTVRWALHIAGFSSYGVTQAAPTTDPPTNIGIFSCTFHSFLTILF